MLPNDSKNKLLNTRQSNNDQLKNENSPLFHIHRQVMKKRKIKINLNTLGGVPCDCIPNIKSKGLHEFVYLSKHLIKITLK